MTDGGHTLPKINKKKKWKKYLVKRHSGFIFVHIVSARNCSAYILLYVYTHAPANAIRLPCYDLWRFHRIFASDSIYYVICIYLPTESDSEIRYNTRVRVGICYCINTAMISINPIYLCLQTIYYACTLRVCPSTGPFFSFFYHPRPGLCVWFNVRVGFRSLSGDRYCRNRYNSGGYKKTRKSYVSIVFAYFFNKRSHIYKYQHSSLEKFINLSLQTNILNTPK